MWRKRLSQFSNGKVLQLAIRSNKIQRVFLLYRVIIDGDLVIFFVREFRRPLVFMV